MGVLAPGRNQYVLLLLFVAALASVRAQAAVLSWSPNTEANLGGYNVYVSDRDQTYPPIDVKFATSHTLTNLPSGRTYWVYVTSYNTNNFESDPSRVIQFPERDCQFALLPREEYLSPWPTFGVFRIITDSECSWRGFSDQPWLQLIAAEDGGTGTQYVYYNVDQNPTSNPRLAHIFVGDQVLTVTQGAASVTPVITTDLPPQISLKEGETLNLAIEATDQSELRYEWYRDGELVFDVTGSRFFVPDVGPEYAGVYTVAVLSAVRTVTSQPATVSVLALPRIEQAPQSATVRLGTDHILSVLAVGQDLSYQWFKDGKTIGGNSSQLSLAAIEEEDLGSYWVRVSNGAGTVTSPVATLRNAIEVTINYIPPDRVQVIGLGTPGRRYSFQVSPDLLAWSSIGTYTADSQGTVGLGFRSQTRTDRRYFRVLLAPSE